MRKELLKQIDEAVSGELNAAFEKFRANVSRHESYAVLLEEYQEMQDDATLLSYELDNIWDATKKNADAMTLFKYLARAQTISRHLIAEAVQTSAMIDKFMAYLSSEMTPSETPSEDPQPKKKIIAPVQQDPEIKKVKSVKLPWNDKQLSDIQLIKDAHAEKRAEKEAEKEEKKDGRKRLDIDDSLIVYMMDEQGKKAKDIAKELGCSLATVYSHYNIGLRNKGEEGKP